MMTVIPTYCIQTMSALYQHQFYHLLIAPPYNHHQCHSLTQHTSSCKTLRCTSIKVYNTAMCLQTNNQIKLFMRACMQSNFNHVNTEQVHRYSLQPLLSLGSTQRFKHPSWKNSYLQNKENTFICWTLSPGEQYWIRVDILKANFNYQ